MSFDFSTLVTDRTQADVSRVKQIAEKIKNGTASESELAEFNSAAMKGAYNYTDLNRVTAAMEALKAKLEGYGYAVPGYQKIKIPHPSAGGGSRLPEGYTELAWIESTGAQWVDTEFKPNQDTKVVMDVQSVGVNTNDTGQSLFGARTASSNMFAAYWHRTNVKYYIFYNSGNTTVDSDRLTNRITVTMDKNNLYVGDSVSVSRDYASFNCDYNLFLFATNLSGNADYFGVNKVYSCQVYDNGMLVRNYVPCINPDGVVGLYDWVTSAFFGNAGTGNFIAGDVVSLPSDVVSMTNLVADGSFETTGTWVTWSADALVTEQSLFGSKSLKLTGDQLANISVATPIVGHKYYGREYIKTDGEVTIGDGRFEVHGGDGVGLNWVYGWNRGNYPNWTMQSAIHEIEVVNASSYVLRTFKVSGTGTCYVDGILLVDLTASFGAGFEPDKEWCDTYIPFFEGTQSVTLPPRYEWKEYDIPTTGQMVVYLQNVSVIRSVLAVVASTPEAPDDMVELMVKEANDIEVILLDVYKQINIMATTFIPCGEALCGGDNL